MLLISHINSLRPPSDFGLNFGKQLDTAASIHLRVHLSAFLHEGLLFWCLLNSHSNSDGVEETSHPLLTEILNKCLSLSCFGQMILRGISYTSQILVKSCLHFPTAESTITCFKEDSPSFFLPLLPHFCSCGSHPI